MEQNDLFFQHPSHDLHKNTLKYPISSDNEHNH
jgi:hypothetical protein